MLGWSTPQRLCHTLHALSCEEKRNVQALRVNFLALQHRRNQERGGDELTTCE